MVKTSQVYLACVVWTCGAQKPCKKPHGANCFEPTLAWDNNANGMEPWDYWKNEHGKTYDTVEVESYRRGVWEDNTRYMMGINAGNNTFSLGWNEYSDLTPEERSIRLEGDHDNTTLTDVLGSSYRGEFRHGHGAHLADYDDEVDWTWADPAVVTYVKHQKCGDCWSFSASGCLEGALAVGNGWTTSLSAQQLVDCSGAGSCDGGSKNHAMDWVKDNYACDWDSYWETGKDQSCWSDCDQIITPGSVWGTYKIYANDEDSLCAGLMQRPIAVSVATGDSFHHYKSGVLTASYPSKTSHAILAVGYGYNSDGTPFWKVKNSWGESWGLDGYGLLFRGGGSNQNLVMSKPYGVYVYGPNNPDMQLIGLDGEMITAPKGPALTRKGKAANFQV